jgi:hypothetical protein
VVRRILGGRPERSEEILYCISILGVDDLYHKLCTPHVHSFLRDTTYELGLREPALELKSDRADYIEC